MSQRSEPYRARRRRLRRLRVAVRSLLERFPAAGGPVQRAWRALRWRVRGARLRLRGDTARREGVTDPMRVAMVPTRSIDRTGSREFSYLRMAGAVVSGDWDRGGSRFEELDIFEAMRAVMVEDQKWQDTAWYGSIASRLEGGETLWGCRSIADLDERCRDIEALFESIRSEGYLSQAELFARGLVDREGEEISVAVARDGELLFSDGAHRLAAAKLLGIESVPVRIAVRHPEWIAYRRSVADRAMGREGRLYQRAMHPDLETFPYSHGCDDRFEMIRSRLRSTGGRLLDIGANWGYFCHRFEDLGFDCMAVEDDPEEAFHLRTIRDAMRRSFDICTDSVLSSAEVVKQDYAVVLALNIFHHFLKTRQRFELFETMLANLRCDEMFLETHAADEPQMSDAFVSMGAEGMVELISRSCDLANVECLGEVGDGREMYHLWA